VHEGDAGDAGGLCGHQRSDENEVRNDDVGWRALNLARDLLGPVRSPPRHASFCRDRVKRPWNPSQGDTANARRDIERMKVWLTQTDDVAYGTKRVIQRLAEREPRLSHARADDESQVVSARRQLRHDRQQDRNIPTTLKHRNEETGRIHDAPCAIAS
jgi:hypothetical protein